MRADLDPAAGNFDLAKSGLAGFLAITGGNLVVTQLFDSGRELHFARVKSRSGELGFGRVVKKAPVGNQAFWKTPLAGKQVTVVLERRDGAVEVVVKADPVARLRLVNAELEVPVFGKTDQFPPPKGKSRFPDPDFGVYYPLSASASTKGRRVAIGTGTPIGSREKPCAPAVLAGSRRSSDESGNRHRGLQEAGRRLAQRLRPCGRDPRAVRASGLLVEQLLEEHVDPSRALTFEGRYTTLIDMSLAPGRVCGTGKPNLFPGSEITPVGGRSGILSCLADDAQGAKYTA